jgi:hypothetical protein
LKKSFIFQDRRFTHSLEQACFECALMQVHIHLQIKKDRNETLRSYTMNRILMTAIAAATFGTVAMADTAADTLMTRSEPASVTVFERDRGISGTDTIAATAGAPAMVDAGLILDPRDQAIAVDGEVTVYSFASPADNSSVTFGVR